LNEPFELVLYDSDSSRLDALRRRIDADAPITFFQGNAIDAHASLHLDAVFVTPMMAYEWGINPPLSPHEAHIFSMPKHREERGLPRLLIAGVGLVPGRSYSAEYLGRVTIEAVRRAVARHNSGSNAPILRVGAFPPTLGLEGPNADHAVSALQELAHDRDEEFARRTA
jgi:hypothetical protein